MDQVGLGIFSVSLGAIVMFAEAAAPSGASAPLYDPAIATTIAVDTELACMLNDADVWPEGIVTVDGTFADAGDAVRFTTTPPAGAGWLSEIVPVVDTPGPIIE